MSDSEGVIESVLKESRKFDPPEAFAREAHIGSLAEYQEIYAASEKDPEGF